MLRSPLNPAHEAAGARFVPGAEPPVLLTFGDVPAEYEAAQKGCALFDQSDRGLLRVTGDDRQAFLHRLLANEVNKLAPGEGNANLLLSSKGKVLFQTDLSVEADAVLLSCPPGQGAGLHTALDMYHFTEAVELEDATETHAPLAICGPGHPAVAAALGLEAELPPHSTAILDLEGHKVRVTNIPVAGSPGLRLDAGPEGAVALWGALREAGATPAGRVVWDALRVEALSAEPGVDIDDQIYPQEARLEPGFSLDKGCYVGQEVVAKIDTYGGLNKCLFALEVDHDDPIPPGTRLIREQDGERRDLGVVTSWSYSFVLDTGVVLAYLKRKHQAEGTPFELEGHPGTATIVASPIRDGALHPTGDQPAAAEAP